MTREEHLTMRIEELEADNKQLKEVTTRLIGCLAVELGTTLAAELINELNTKR